jgi:CBS domain-containing protein
MGKVRDILDEKGRRVISVSPDVTVFRALETMADKNIGGLLVMDRKDLLGIFTERDYARKVILKGKSSKDTLVKDLMTRDPVTVTPDSSVDDCMHLMTDKFIRHLPVVGDSGAIIGVISIGDVVRFVISEQRYVIEQLEGYISGR